MIGDEKFIPGADFLQASPASPGRTPPPDPIVQALSAAPKVRREWAPIFATNLGSMAQDLNPANPRAGAKAMFQCAFGRTFLEMWRKRGRWLRLPGEVAPQFRKAGDYGSGTAAYRQLAVTYANMKWPDDLDSERRALHRLVRGSSIAPDRPIIYGDLDGIRGAIARLSHIEQLLNADMELASAFRHLARYPIAPFGPDELDHEPTEGNMGAAIRGENFSIVGNGQPTIAFCRRYLPVWFTPRVFLGHVYCPRPILEIPLDITATDYDARLREAEALRPNDSADDLELEFVTEIVSKKLSELGLDGFWFDDEYLTSPPDIPEEITGRIYDRLSLVLMVKFRNNKLELGLSITNKERFEFENGEIFLIDRESGTPQIYKIGNKLKYDKCIVDIFNEKSLDHWGEQIVKSVLRDNDIHVIDVQGRLHAINGWQNLHAVYSDLQFVAVSDDDSLPLLTLGSDQGSGVFRADVWDDPARLAPAPHQSIAATILRNLAFAPEALRIDTLLIEDARRRMAGLNEFVEEQLSTFFSSIGEKDEP